MRKRMIYVCNLLEVEMERTRFWDGGDGGMQI